MTPGDVKVVAQPPHKPAHRTIKTALFAGAAMLACAAASGAAQAGPTTTAVLLNTPSSASGIASGTFGTITLTQTTTDEVTVNVALVSDASTNVLFINSGDGFQSHNVFGFNLDAKTLSKHPSINTISPGTFAGLTVGGSYPNKPFGTFNAAFSYTPTNARGQGKGTVNGSAGPLEFTVTDTSGIEVSDFINNSHGYTFAADLSVANLTTHTKNTGIVAATAPTPSGGGNLAARSVPEPGSLILLATGLVGLGLVARRKHPRI